MRKSRAYVFVVGLAACSGNNNAPVDAHIVAPDAAADAKVFLDAPPPMFDLTCLGNSPPTTQATVTIAGTVTEGSVGGIVPLAGATVDACQGNCVGGNKLDTKTSDASGNFTEGPITTNGTAIVGYLKMTKAGDRTTFTYPHAAIATDLTGVPVLTFPPLVITLLSNLGCTQDDTTKGMVAVVADDCAGTRITDNANLAIAVKQGGSAVGGIPIDLGALDAMAAGVFLVCNVPESATTNVGATYSGHTLLAHDVGITKATTTLTEIRPGY